MAIQKLLSNPLIDGLSNLDWGKNVASFSEMVVKEKYDGQQVEYVSPNQSGYDLLINGQRIQCKLRQVNGKSPFSKSVYLSTTRRHSIKNFNKNVNGQVCYSSEEFDYVFVTLVYDRNRRIADWHASLFPVQELEDRKGNVSTTISAKLLKKYEIVGFFQ